MRLRVTRREGLNAHESTWIMGTMKPGVSGAWEPKWVIQSGQIGRKEPYIGQAIDSHNVYYVKSCIKADAPS